jgi:hypothetical protein
MSKKIPYYVMLLLLCFMVTAAMAEYPNCSKCDIVENGRCDANDSNAFYASAGWTGPPKELPPWYTCDLNEDGICNGLDYEIFTEAFDRISCKFGLVECDLVPDDTVTSMGGALKYTFKLRNIRVPPGPFSFAVASDITAPDGTKSPVITPRAVSLAAGVEVTKPDLSIPIPGGADPGIYTYSGYLLRAGAPLVEGLPLVGRCNFEFEVADCFECTQHSDCGDGQYCQKPVGDCDPGATGCCAPRPSRKDCLRVPNTGVCGCNGKTYADACEAAQAGVTVECTGPCPCP